MYGVRRSKRIGKTSINTDVCYPVDKGDDTNRVRTESSTNLKSTKRSYRKIQSRKDRSNYRSTPEFQVELECKRKRLNHSDGVECESFVNADDKDSVIPRNVVSRNNLESSVGVSNFKRKRSIPSSYQFFHVSLCKFRGVEETAKNSRTSLLKTQKWIRNSDNLLNDAIESRTELWELGLLYWVWCVLISGSNLSGERIVGMARIIKKDFTASCRTDCETFISSFRDIISCFKNIDVNYLPQEKCCVESEGDDPMESSITSNPFKDCEMMESNEMDNFEEDQLHRQWLIRWCNKFGLFLGNVTKSSNISVKKAIIQLPFADDEPRNILRKSYSRDFKLAVAEYGLKEGKRKAARAFGVADSLVRTWIRTKDDLKKLIDDETDTSNTKPTTMIEVERNIREWYESCKNRDKHVTKPVLMAKANRMFREAGFVQFRTGAAWYRRWSNMLTEDECQNEMVDEDTARNVNVILKPSEEICDKNTAEIPDEKYFENESDLNSSTDVKCVASENVDICENEEGSVRYVIEIKDDEMYIVDSLIKDPPRMTDNTWNDERCNEFDVSNILNGVASEMLINFEGNSNDDISNFTEYESNRRKKGERYLPQFKRRVIQFAKNHNYKETAKKFCIHHSTVSDWCHRTKIRNHGGEMVEDAEHPDKLFVDWLTERNDKKQDLCFSDVKAKVGYFIKEADVGCGSDKKCKWFYDWYRRLLTDNNDDEILEEFENSVGTGKTGIISYPTAFKKEIANYGRRNSISGTQKIFCISRRQISRWIGDDVKIVPSAHAEKRRRKRPGRTSLSTEADSELFSWYESQIEVSGFKPKSEEIRAKAVGIFSEKGCDEFKNSFSWFKRWCVRYGIVLRHEHDDQIIEWILAQFDQNKTVPHNDLQSFALDLITKDKPEFKSSSGWVMRFLKRHPNIVSVVTPFDHKLPVKMEESVRQFQARMNRLIGSINGIVGCMDEIPLNFRNVSPTGLDAGSSMVPRKRKLLMRHPGMDGCHASVVLSCLSDGQLLPPMIVLKGKSSDRLGSRAGLVFRDDDASTNDLTMKRWIDSVWKKYVSSNSLLIMDCFDVHKSDVVRDALKSIGTVCGIIPAGCSSKLQPLDMGIKKLFQKHLESLWQPFNDTLYSNTDDALNGESFRVGNKIYVPDNRQIIDWVDDIYEKLKIDVDSIRNSFKMIGLAINSNENEQSR